FATARPPRSGSFRSRRSSPWTATGGGRGASHSEASPTSRGDRQGPRLHSWARRRPAQPSMPPPLLRSETLADMATTISKSRLPAGHCAPRSLKRPASAKEIPMAQSDLAGPIGRPLDRVDGPLKVTGRAKYAFEYAAQGEAAYGFIVSAAIGKGRVIGVDVRDAERAPGVLLVLTQDNAPPQTLWGPVDLPDRFARAEPALDTDAVRYFGFPVAFVVAETFEQARAAAALVHLRYGSQPGELARGAPAPQGGRPGVTRGGPPADSAIGDFEAAFAAALVKIDAAYTTPYQHSAPMEPHASM